MLEIPVPHTDSESVVVVSQLSGWVGPATGQRYNHNTRVRHHETQTARVT